MFLSYVNIFVSGVSGMWIINNQTSSRSTVIYDKNTDCVSLHLRCLRHGKYRHYEELLDINLNLENQLSNIVGNCTYNKFKVRPKSITMEAFMIATFFNQTTNIPGNGEYDERKQVIDEELQTSKDKPDVISDKSILEDTETTGNKSDSETGPKSCRVCLLMFATLCL